MRSLLLSLGAVVGVLALTSEASAHGPKFYGGYPVAVQPVHPAYSGYYAPRPSYPRPYYGGYGYPGYVRPAYYGGFAQPHYGGFGYPAYGYPGFGRPAVGYSEFNFGFTFVR
ncbi:MAG: hypothetical protein ACRC7O_19155 [Fimbriiglobus sp.]